MRNTKLYIFSVLLSFGGLCVSAQESDQALRSIRANNTMNQLSEGNGNLNTTGLYGMGPSTSTKVLGDPYWDVHWGISSVELKGGKELVEGNYVRYDIYNDELEFLLKDGIKIIPGSKVVSVVWQDSLFSKARFLVNANKFKQSGVPLTGFVEILVDNEIALLKRMTLNIKKPTYNQALDVGNKDSRIVKEEVYYYSVNNTLARLKSKKDIKAISPKNQAVLEAFVKEKKIKFNNERDLILFIEYCNSLSKN